MFIEIGLSAVAGLALGARYRAPMLVAASLFIVLAALARHWDTLFAPAGPLWPLLLVWLDLATMQLGFVVGAYMTDMRLELETPGPPSEDVSTTSAASSPRR